MHLNFHLFCFIFQLGKDYFDHQPSWFDTLSNNGGYLEVENFPVTAKEIQAKKNVRSNSRPTTESAKGVQTETYKIIFHTFNRPQR